MALILDITEIQRGLAGIGNFQLKTEFLHARIPKDEICIPRHVIKQEDIAELCFQLKIPDTC
jgi:hypothetical protein